MWKSRVLSATVVWSGVLIVGVEPPRALGGVYVEIRPVQPEATGPTSYPPGTIIDGDTIYLPHGGTKLWLNLFVGDWAPDLAENLQATIDQASLASGLGAPLERSVQSCDPSSDCASAYGTGATCDGGVCTIAFYDCSRSDSICSLFSPITGVSQANLIFGWTPLPGTPAFTDPGFPVYTGTLVLRVPEGASGTYTIDALSNAATYFLTSEGEVPISEVITARIVVAGPCCEPGGACSSRSPDDCVAMNGVVVPECLGDCNGNGRDDGCEMLIDCNGNGVLDECDIEAGTDSDCDGNAVPDGCDLADGADDCDANGTLDECEISGNDCNNNGVLDVCETQGGGGDCDGNGVPDFCDLGAGSAVDCNDNGTLDDCDIADGTSPDVDGNCIPDECDQNPTPLAEVDGQEKSRFISFVGVNAGCNVAIRVTMESLTPLGVGDKFASFEGQWRWVGPTTVQTDVTLDGEIYNTLSLLQCDPHYMGWGPVGLIHAYGPEVMPDSVYDVQFFDGDCGDENDPGCFSAPLTLTTAHWGDVDQPFFGGPDSAVQPDIRDVAAIVRNFVGGAEPSKMICDLDPNLLNVEVPIDFRDISACVNVLRDGPYPFDGPEQCP